MTKIFTMLLVLTTVTMAQNQPLLIKDSRSPDGKLELWIKPPMEDEGEASGTVQIRQVQTQKLTGTFEWSGFGVHADSTAFIVLWRSDSKYFAIKYEETRGWMTGNVYGVHKDGRWTEVKLPIEEYDKAIKKLAGVADFYGKGCDSPVQWLLNGDLTLEFVDRNLIYDHDDVEKEFVINLRVADQKKEPLPTAKLVSIKQKSYEETVRGYQSR